MARPTPVGTAPVGSSSTLPHPALRTTYPVHLIVRDRPCLVVGGGNVAVRKIEGLLAAGAKVTVIAPRIHPAIEELPVDLVRRPYRAGGVAGHRLVIACTDDPTVNRQVHADGEAAGVWVNSADDPDNCSWILPSVVRRGDLTITASTNGRSPAMAAWLRRRFEAEIDERYTDLLDLLAEVRAETRAHFGTSEVAGWGTALDDGVFELVASGHIDAARELLRGHVGLAASVPAPTAAEVPT